MYGKFFASTFTGSMMASGPEVFAVWSYVIAHAVDGHVELNPNLLAAVIGSTPDRMRAAIELLCQPDQHSRSPENEGRRMVREGEYLYSVTNHVKYRSIRNEDERREYNRLAKQKERQRKSSDVSMTVNECQACQPIQKQIQKQKQETPLNPRKRGGVSEFPPGFEAFWTAYPRKTAKAAASKAFARLRADDALLTVIVEAVNRQAKSEQWRKDDGQFVPHAATWLNGRRWEDIDAMPDADPYGLRTAL